MSIVTLGPAGTYSHRAARAVNEDVVFRESVSAIISVVGDNQYQRGVVPIENSIEGSVTETLDAIAEAEIAVTNEIITPIRHALLAQSPEFKRIASHSQALAQCRSYLEREYPDTGLEAVASTARGVEQARADGSVAGIGHPDNAGEILSVIAEDIQDQSSNSTRFFVIAPRSERDPAGGKSTVVVYPNANYPGLLLELLEAFAERDINLSRIESRPSGNRLGDYLFHIDFDAGLYEERAQAALEQIESIAADGWIKRLGSYDRQHVLY
jgi:prephenate dehydratase